MATQGTKKENIVTIFKERKPAGVTKNDDFYNYVDLSVRKYFGKDNQLILNKIQKLENLTELQKNQLFRNLLIVKITNQGGYIDVRWEKLFNQNIKDLTNTVEVTMDYIKKKFPFIIEKWDDAITKLEREDQKNKGRNQ